MPTAARLLCVDRWTGVAGVPAAGGGGGGKGASQPWEGRVGERGRSGSLFYAVWAVPTGGWDAAQGLDPSDESDDFDLRGPAIWHSPDGLAWTNLKAFEDTKSETQCIFAASELHGAADAAGRRIAAAGDGGGCGAAGAAGGGRAGGRGPR